VSSRDFSYFCSVKSPDGNIKETKSVKKHTWRRNLKAFSLHLNRRQQEGENLLKLLGSGKQALTKTQQLLNRKPKTPKPVKKNTWRRKLKALDLKLDRKQREKATRPEADDTAHVCINCGEEYTGRFCPQCGQAGTWSRFSWRQAALNLLDIWGLGSRPIFRTIRDLFWRPGYMVRDYLNGHRQYYFPPFKLLAVTLVILISVSYLVKKVLLAVGGSAVNLDELGTNSIIQPIMSLIERHPLKGNMMIFSDALLGLFKLLSRNLLYEWLFLAIFMVLCIWIAHRRVGKYNFVETYIFFVFVLCQEWILLIFQKMGIGLCRLVELPALMSANINQTPFIGIVASAFGIIAGLVSTVFVLYKLYLFLLDFHQFYGLTWKSTVRHLFLTALVMGWFVMIGLLLVVAFSGQIDDEEPGLWLGIISIILIPLIFIFVSGFLKKNEAHVPRIVTRICKVSMLSVFGVLALGQMYIEEGYTFMSVFAMILLYIVVVVGLSILPVIIYRKYHHTWLAFLPVPLLITIIYLFAQIK